MIVRSHILTSNSSKAEEEFWNQRSRLLWLTLGDKNTTFFHASTKGRRACNRISVVEDASGTAVFEDEQIAQVISKYFSDVFTSSSSSSPQEIKEAMFANHPDKALGPDGFSASFFQSNWEVVGPVLQNIVSENQSAFIPGRTISDNVPS